jgi:hypothetical protein
MSVPDAFRAAVAGAATAIDLDAALADFERDGFARLGCVAGEGVLGALRDRADAIMQGRVLYDELFFQKDSDSGRYEDLPYGKGWQGPTDRYRKIEKLEVDPLYRAWLENPLFGRIARRLLGDEVFLLRAMLMTKPARGGTPLPWHQDAGRFWGVSQPPRLQIWTALDDAPIDAGCMEIVAGSHRQGLATLQGGTVPRAIVEAREADAHATPLPARAGEVILLHNLAWHRSALNATDRPRRAFSVCFVDKDTRCTRTRKAPRRFEPLFR